MKTITLSKTDLDRLASMNADTVLKPGQREQLAVAYQVALASGTVIPPQLAKVAKALSFDRVII